LKALSLVLWSSCLLLLLPRTALAVVTERGSARLEVQRGPGTEQCIDAVGLKRAVELRLQRRAFRADTSATLDVRVQLSHSAAGFRADLTLRARSGALLGRRSLLTAAPHCSALDDSLALVVALLVDAPQPVDVASGEPNSATSAAPAEAASGHAAAPTPAPPVADEAAILRVPQDTPARREPWQFEVSAAALATAGPLPGLAPGAELGFGAKPPALPSIRLFAGMLPARRLQRADRAAGARFSLLQLGLEVCPLSLGSGVVHWFGCAGQSLGRLRVAAFGFDDNQSKTHLVYSLLLQTGLTISLAGPLSARFAARAELPLLRGVFEYGSSDGTERALFETTPLTGTLDAGLLARW